MKREEVDRLAARLDAVLEAVEARADPETMALVAELVEGLRRVHGEALRRLTELLAEDRERFRRALDDPVVSNLLYLYDLVMVDERARAERALEAVQPLARAHGGEIRIVSVEDGVVRVRLLGACHGCPSSSATLRQGLEKALVEKLPGFVGLEVVGEGEAGPEAPGAGGKVARTGSGPPRPEPRGAPGSAGGHRGGSPTGDVSRVPEKKLVQLQRTLDASRSGGESRSRGDSGDRTRPEGGDGTDSANGGAPRRAEVAPLDEVPARSLLGRLIRGVPVLLLRGEGGPRAFRNACPGSILPLHLGAREDGEVRCPWHGCRFDLDTGERIGGGGAGLEELRCGVEDGRVWVELPS